MGNRIALVAGQCCQPSTGQEAEMSSIKVVRTMPKVKVVVPTEPSDHQTEIKSTKDEKDEIKLDESTATSAFGPSFSPKLNAVSQEVVLRMDEVNNSQTQSACVRVPFIVIQLTLAPRLLRMMSRYCEQSLGRFQEGCKVGGWILTKKGHYVSSINDAFISIFSENAFYQGTVRKDFIDNYIPNGNGLLLTETGIYKGSFSQGKADGKGEFIDGQSNLAFRGEWKEGIFIDGIIENDELKYTGQMKDRVIEGRGRLLFKKDNSEFIGSFRNGIYEGENCLLKCPHYTYEGSFKAGRKEGKGTLIEHEQKIDMKIGSTRIKKYRPPSNLHGEWEKDNLMTIITEQ